MCVGNGGGGGGRWGWGAGVLRGVERRKRGGCFFESAL